MVDAVSRYFDLGFGPRTEPAADRGVAVPRPRLPLGGRKRRDRAWLWTVAAWLAMSSGIFLRQAILLKQMDWDLPRLGVGPAFVSAVVGLALLPPAMRWLNSRRSKAGAMQIVSAFSVGFLVDLASVATLRHL